MQSTRSIGRAALLLLDFAPDEACQPVLLPVPWWAFTPPFHPYRFWQAKPGGIFSVALSVEKPFPALRPGVTRHHALRSPDFPPRVNGG